MRELFKDDASMYTFILLYTTGENKSNLLGITRRCFVSQEYADQWRNKILSAFTDKLPDMPDRAEEALAELERIYAEMG